MLAAAIEPLIGCELPVRLIAWDGSVAGPAAAPVVWLRSAAALRRMLWHPGELGAAQAYVCGDLDVDGDLGSAMAHVWSRVGAGRLGQIRPSPGAVARLCVVAARLGAFRRPLPPPAAQARVRARLHSLSRGGAVISHDDDFSHAFYRLLLDQPLAYSCAYWDASRPNTTLAQAQYDKLDRICRKVGLDEHRGMRFLDVGCGWGSLSLHAAERYGARVLGVTSSSAQKAYVENEAAKRGLSDRVEIRVQDYRTITDEPFDAATSIEMGEHVGRQDYPSYARILHRSLRPGARVLIHQMSSPSGHPGGGLFIESFIAPEMNMRPLGQTIALLEDAGLSTIAVEAIREHYLRTVDAWIDNLETRWNAGVALIGEEGARIWRLYLAGGRLAFAQGRMRVDQILLARPTPAVSAGW